MGAAARPGEELAARNRLTALAAALPVRGWDRARWLPSDSNDAWRLDDVVLRVCWRGDRRRLQREALLAPALPASLRHPEVLAAGDHGGLTWQLTHFVPGAVLADMWLEMEPARLRELVAELAQMLKTLHGWTPPPAVGDALAEREEARGDIVGVNLLPLPVARAIELIDPASRLPFVDHALLRAVERRIEALAELDPFARDDEPRAVVHGDAQPSNLIVDDHGIAALLDYEWCRLAPIDAELAIWLHILRVAEIGSPGRVLPPVLRWLREDYPELFASPDVEGRLWLYALTFGLQGVLIWPPDRDERTLVAEHHVHALRTLVDAPPWRDA